MLVKAENFDKAAEALYEFAAKSVYGRNAIVRSIRRMLTRNDSTCLYTGWIGYEPGENLCTENGKNIQMTVKSA